MCTDSVVLESRAPRPAARRAPRDDSLIVVKFGGAALATHARVRAAAARVRSLRDAGHALVVVASARGDTTDRLLRDIGAVDPSFQVPTREADRVLATGEALSAALLASALAGAGVPAESVGPEDAVLVAEGDYGCASLRELRPGRIERLLASGVVPVVPGFQGIRADGELVTLGRGGSDVTAVFLASELSARECHLVKDVDGIYDRDPAVVEDASRFDHLSFDTLVQLSEAGARVVHTDAARQARQDTVLLRVYRYDASVAGGRGTRVGAEVLS
jgi:aspartate kinase